jgi:hypothetical protein
MKDPRVRVLLRFGTLFLIAIAILITGLVIGDTLAVVLGAILFVLNLSLIVYGLVRTQQVMRGGPPNVESGPAVVGDVEPTIERGESGAPPS